MQINRINKVSFGALENDLQQNMMNAVRSVKGDFYITQAYLDYKNITKFSAGSLLFEKRIETDNGTKGVIRDNMGIIPDIDVSAAYNGKENNTIYLKMIKIVADYLKLRNPNNEYSTLTSIY